MPWGIGLEYFPEFPDTIFMEVVDLKDIIRKEMAIDYRRVYTATAVLDLAGAAVEKKIEMALEHTPFGEVGIKITMLEDVDYPLIPVLKKIGEKARVLQREGTIY
jgi:hypothetical protein